MARQPKTGHVILKLTPRQAKLLWDIIDGASDAGACEDGLTPLERRGLDQISTKLLPHILKRSRNGG